MPDTTCHMSISLDGAEPPCHAPVFVPSTSPRSCSGERMFDGVEIFGFEPVEVLHSPRATHIRYRRAG